MRKKNRLFASLTQLQSKRLSQMRESRWGPSPRRPPRCSSCLEELEARSLLTTFTVYDTGNSGPGSLRQAILSANSTPGLDTIIFGVGTGVQTIRPTTALPAITDPVVIDGTTQPGYVLRPIIELDGVIAGVGSKGLVISAGGSVVRGLVIRRFGSTGIELHTGGGNTVEGNFIGTDVTGAAASGNGSAGVDVVDSSNNTIGGMTPASRNVISGNDGDGIDIRWSGSSHNVVQGNLIGTDVTGTIPIGIGANGIRITLGAKDNGIGGVVAGAGNVISGNTEAGVEIENSPTADDVIVGNLIGTNVTGTTAIGNTTPAISANSTVYGQSVTFTATVSPALLVTGSVTFLDGATVLGTTSLYGGTATFTTSTLSAGAHSIVARYNGDFLHASSVSAPVNQTVAPAALSVTAIDASKVYGQANPSFTYSHAGLVNGDTNSVFSGSLTTLATAGSSVGTYGITQGTLSAGPNYAIGFTGGLLTVNPAALTVDSKPITATEGLPFSAVVATFIDADPNVTASHFLATIDWGDGQTSQGVIGYDAVALAFTVSGTHTYAQSGDYDIDVTIHGVDGAMAETSSTATVADAALTGSGRTIAATEGAALNAVVADFTDANPNGTAGDFVATIDWGDDRTSTGVVTYDEDNKVFVIRGTHEYEEVGAYSVAVHIHDRGGASTVVASTANVADERLTGRGRIIMALAGSPRTEVVASFGRGDDASPASDYEATITWGDGHDSPGVVTLDGHGGYLVTGTNTYATVGIYAVRVTIRDGSGASLVIRSLSLVWGPPRAVGRTFSATAGTLFEGVVATLSNTYFEFGGSYSFAATIDWGDVASAPGVVTPDGEGQFSVRGSHTFSTPGTYPVAITMTTAGGLTTTVQSLALVTEVGRPGGDDPPGDVDPPVDDGPPGVEGPELPIIPTGVTNAPGEIVGQPTVVVAGPAGAFLFSPVVTPTISAPSTPLSPAVSIPPATGIVTTQGNAALPSPTSPSSLSSDSPTPIGSSQPGAVPAGPGVSDWGAGAKPGPKTPQANPGGVDALTAGFFNALLARLDVAGGEAGAVAAAIAIRQALESRASDAPATQAPATEALRERNFPGEQLWGELDTLERQVMSGGSTEQVGEVFGAGVVAYVGYVLLNSRSVLWLLSLLTARPLWKQFDPLQVLLAWDEERGRTSRGRTEDEDEDEDEESLQSLVGAGRITGSDIESHRHVKNQSRPRKPHHEPPVRRARTRTSARP